MRYVQILRRARAVWPWAIFLGLTLPHLHHVPFYDGAVYYLCIERIATEIFRLATMQCDGHITHVYFGLLALTQFFGSNLVAIYLLNMALVATAGFCLQRYCRLQGYTSGESQLWLAMYLVLPSLVVHIFHINLDLALTALYTLLIVLLLEQRIALAMVVGCGMLFTKETGIPLYGTTVFLAFFCLHRTTPWRQKMQHWWILTLPPIVLAMVMGYSKWIAPDALSMWIYAPRDRDIWHTLAALPFSDIRFRDFLFNALALNGLWALTAAIAITSVTSAYQGHWRRASGETIFLAVLLLATLYWSTRIRNWNNARYVLMCWPCLLLLAQRTFRTCGTKPSWRIGFLSLFFGLIFLGNVRTIDPVSRWYYGTFLFGTHTMLHMNAHNPDALRDQWAYNSQFLELHRVTDQIMREIQPTPETLFIVAPGGNFYFPLRIRQSDFGLTASPVGSYGLLVNDVVAGVTASELKKHYAVGTKFYYLQLPNLRHEAMLPRLLAEHRLERLIRAEENGYTLTAYEFSLR